jgi:hypothetical protein
MGIWTTKAGSSRTPSSNVPKTRVTTVKFSVNGLLPNSSYTFWCNGADMTWACRTSGTRQGSGLVTDASGSILVLFSCEIAPDFSSSSQGLVAKYHNMYLKDTNGDVKAVSITPQRLTQK